MSKKIKILSVLLSATMVMSSLCACSSPATNSSESSKLEDNSSSESSQAEEFDPNVDGDLVLNEPGEFPLIDGDPIKLSIFTQYKEDQNSKLDASENTMTEWIENLLNVDLEWNVVSAADKTAKLNLLFQSNNYEDIIFSTLWDSATQYTYGKQGYLLPLNEYLEYDSYYYQRYIDDKISEGENDQTHWDSLTMPDGNVYSMGRGNGGSHTDYTFRMWVFEPWLDTLGLEVPTTTDGFYDMLAAMRDGDPNGNGKADEIPLAGSTDGWNADPFVYLANSFLYYTENGYYYLDDGKIEMAYMQDQFKDALSYYHTLIRDGLMMPDSFTQDQTALKALATSSLESRVIGATPAGYCGVFANFTNREDGEWTDWISIAPLEGPDGVRYAHLNSVYPSAIFNITNLCDTPKAAFRFCDALYEKEVAVSINLGPENVGWRYIAEGGEEGITGAEGGEPDFAEIDVDKSVTNYKWNSLVTDVSTTWEWAVTGDPNLNNGPRLWKTAKEHKLYAPSSDMILPPLIFDEDDSKRVIDISTTIKTYLEEAIAKFAINGGVEEGWDAHIQYLKDCGVEELLDLYQTAYDERMVALG